MSATDILIIGAGPTGLMLALELALQGITFRIVDSAPRRPEQSRAVILHSRTLELISRHKIMDELFQLGKENMGMRMYTNQKFVFGLDFQDLDYGDTQFGTPLMISQAETERVLDKALSGYGLTVERPLKAERVEQDDDGATAWLRSPDGNEEKVSCKYVVGCDGSHSIVRKSTGLKFEGGVYPQEFILADVRLKWDQPSLMHVNLGAGGFLMCLPLENDTFRLSCSRPREWGKDTEPKIEHFKMAMDSLAPGNFEILSSTWITRFRLHHRIVDNYRDRKFLLAGDSAHIHSPLGGQGMNAGMQDSVNLGWKLALVLRGEETDAFLDTYNQERHRVGTHLVQTTDRAFEFVSTANPFLLFLRNTLLPWIAPWLMRSKEARARRFRFLSQLGVRYRHSSIVSSASTWMGTLKGGDRAPDGKINGETGVKNLHELFQGPGHHLILFSGVGFGTMADEDLDKVADTLKHSIPAAKIHKILDREPNFMGSYTDVDGALHKLYGFGGSGVVLVRPDGYIKFIGNTDSIEELERWTKA
ncbi:6-methylpretetramide 4-monooxygenase [Lachnellula suecica]|uniref:6-methylpretetramide 4-monooxygenase n=1 Tax=Lachnellula suecica TaxID=602035 RepID=A0A8T9C6W9_9HELO|nr:6-methylpretetramide 4-monooxygenase [Lachnellula suecica]